MKKILYFLFIVIGCAFVFTACTPQELEVNEVNIVGDWRLKVLSWDRSGESDEPFDDTFIYLHLNKNSTYEYDWDKSSGTYSLDGNTIHFSKGVFDGYGVSYSGKIVKLTSKELRIGYSNNTIFIFKK